MAAGYTRQAAANIAPGLAIQSADHNAEYNQIQAAFDGTTGHDHTGGSGLGPKISLTTSVSGILPIANGGSGSSSYTSGSVLFSNGTIITQNNSNLFWNNSTNALGVGTAVPTDKLHAHSSTAVSTRLHLTNSTTGAAVNDGVVVAVDGSGVGFVWNYENQPLIFATNNTERIRLNSGGNLSIGNFNNTYKLDVTGDMNISGTYRVGGTALAASHLSNGVTGSTAIVLATSPTIAGTLTAAGNLTVAGTSNLGTTNLGVTDITGNLTGDTASFSGDFGIGGNLNVTGNVAASTISLVTDLAISEGGTGASTAANAFANIAVVASTLGSPGYIHLRNGLIFQWGSAAVAGATSSVVNFPIAFGTSLFTVQVTAQQTAGATMSAGTASETVNGFTITLSSSFTGTAWWFAVGV